jgi:hypothetical protein
MRPSFRPFKEFDVSLYTNQARLCSNPNPNAMDLIGLDWIGLDWIGLDRIGFDWIRLDWIGLDWIAGLNGVRSSPVFVFVSNQNDRQPIPVPMVVFSTLFALTRLFWLGRTSPQLSSTINNESFIMNERSSIAHKRNAQRSIGDECCWSSTAHKQNTPVAAVDEDPLRLRDYQDTPRHDSRLDPPVRCR